MKILISTITLSSLLLLNGCGSSGNSSSEDKSVAEQGDPVVEQVESPATTDQSDATGSNSEELKPNEKLGKLLFFDKSISKTKNTNCATCHDPDHAFIDARYQETDTNQTIFVNGAFSVGDDGVSLGGRNAPTATYAMFSPEFGEKDDVYKGGQFHDGRAATLKIQAMGPPLDGAEMMMPDKSFVVERIKENAEYTKQFKELYGEDIFDDEDNAFDKMAEAISDFEKTKEFSPFDSKFDKWVEGKAEFTELEKRGFDLFNSDKTSCRLCHTVDSTAIVVDKTGKNRELFTNYEYDNVGAPRNIVAMDRRAELGLQPADAKFEGLGGLVEDSTHNGKSRVPTLRNISVTAPYMSNGKFQKLRTVIEFYDFMSGKGTHNINKETNKAWGENDFPETVNHTELSQTGNLSDSDIDALIAFLRTLTDEKYEHLIPKR